METQESLHEYSLAMTQAITENGQDTASDHTGIGTGLRKRK